MQEEHVVIGTLTSNIYYDHRSLSQSDHFKAKYILLHTIICRGGF